MNIYESGPGRGVINITPNDATILEGVRALWVGTGGDVVIQCPGQSTSATFLNVPSGALLPVKVERVLAATDADDIVGIL